MEDWKSLNQDEFSTDDSDLDLSSNVSVFDDESHLEKGMKDRNKLLGKKQSTSCCDKWLDKDSIFTNKVAIHSILAYVIMGAGWTMFDEAFPLFSMSEGSAGGLNFTTTDIGIVGAITGGVGVFIQLFIFYPICVRLGFVRTFRFGLLVAILIFANFPSLHFFLGNKILTWASLSVLVFLKVFCGQLVFSSISAIISNTCPLTQVGAINGFAQSAVALSRAVSPAIAGNLLAWGFSNGYGFPLNQYLVFILMSIFMVVALSFALFLPRSLDFPYEDPTLLEKEKEKDGKDHTEDDTDDDLDDEDGADGAGWNVEVGVA